MKKQLLFTALTLGATLTLSAQDVTNGLVSKYTFDNDSIEDIIGNNNGTTELVTYNLGYGGSGKCISFDGYDGGQLATTSKGMIDDSIVPFDQDFTISFWFRVNDYNLNQPMNILSSRRTETGSEAGGIEFMIRKDPFNTLQVAGRSISGGLNDLYIIESGGVLTNQWYFATFTQSGSYKNLYLNGSEVESVFTGNVAEQSNFWSVGASTNPGQAEREFDGDIDEVRFYNRALTAQEVTQLYNFNPSTVNLDVNTLNNDIQVFPNPAEDLITISSDKNLKNVTILSTDGKTVYSGSNTENIDVSALNSGLFIIRFTLENDQTVTKRIIKN